MDIIGLTSRAVRFFDTEPVIAGLSFSNFGSAKGVVPGKMSKAVAMAKERWPLSADHRNRNLLAARQAVQEVMTDR